MNIFLLLGIGFVFTFIAGTYLEKIHVPWIFGALLFGALLALFSIGTDITQQPAFELLGQLGMYFLLFSVGLEIDLASFKKYTGNIVKSTAIILGCEAIAGSLFIHFVFSYSWMISALVALSFATVGEAILVPILREFDLLKRPLGELIIGVGTFDDIVEIFTLIIVVFLISSHEVGRLWVILLALGSLFGLTMLFTKFEKEIQRFKFVDVEIVFFASLALLLIFLGIGSFADAAPLAAFIAGLAVKTFIPPKRLELIRTEMQAATYGLLAPIFFIWVGSTIDFGYLTQYPLLILAVVAISNSAKIVGSIISNGKELGTKRAVLLGIGLSVRFSTSIVIVKLLLDNGIISIDLYSIIIASSIVFKFVIPVLFSYLITKWELQPATAS